MLTRSVSFRSCATSTPSRTPGMRASTRTRSMMQSARPREEHRKQGYRSFHNSERASASIMMADEGMSAKNWSLLGAGLLGAAAFWMFSQAEELVAAEKEQADVGIRQKIIGQYENRIREMSSPEKIFEYFASVQKGSEWFMTPQDFLRSLRPYDYRPDTPVGAGGNALGPTGVKVASDSTHTTEVPAIFRLVDQNSDGLISFVLTGVDIFFVTLLGIPEKDVRIAFKLIQIFDINGDGEVDTEEFKKVMTVLRSESNVASAQRSRTSQVENAGLIPHFFGNDGKKKLKAEKFEQFIRDLHDGVLALEFQALDTARTGTISARDFGMTMVSFGNLHDQPEYRERVELLRQNPNRFTMKQFSEFQRVLKHLDDIDTAVHFYTRIGPFGKNDFQRATQAVTGIHLDASQLDVLWFIFDKNGDGKLAANEFYDVMKGRQTLGLTKPRDAGVGRFFTCAKDCFKSTFANRSPSEK